MNKLVNRRRVLRGAAGITVGLPFLDCFLNSSGTALAATNAQLPVCFGTWWQGLGMTPGRWVPDKVGAGYEVKVEMRALTPFRDKMNIISGTKYFMDGRPLETHTTGWQIGSTGRIPLGINSGASLDSQIADVIGTKTRFRSIEVSLDGSTQSYSKRAGSASNPSEGSPSKLYARIFGPEFKDPNAADFTPDPKVMARRSVLSYVADERKDVMKQLGASDRARLDEYFSALRQIEQQLDIELQKPAPLAACTVPTAFGETQPGKDIVEAGKNSKLFGGLLAHALACGQTRVFNINVGAGGLRKAGSTQGWHSWTHEEPIDEKLGYQKEVTSFIEWGNETFAELLRQLEGVKEGSGNVLDRTVILWQSDHGIARTHTMDFLPILTVGKAGGRLKTGIHVSAAGDPATRVGLTMQQIMGVPLSSWGALSNETSKTVTEIVA
ncbi:MAG: DUF1552 domain-containing protein [Rhodospirillaceae bacterium]|nr:DUF1552 domain-containing protein [Rhodospirillaceae bacterium]